MYALNLVFGSPAVSWALLFNTREAADAAWDNYQTTKLSDFNGTKFIQGDDFGQQACIERSSLHGALLEDMDKSKLAAVERGLHQTRTQIAAEKAAQTDPGISAFVRTRAAMGGGPPMLGLGPNGAFRQ